MTLFDLALKLKQITEISPSGSAAWMEVRTIAEITTIEICARSHNKHTRELVMVRHKVALMSLQSDDEIRRVLANVELLLEKKVNSEVR